MTTPGLEDGSTMTITFRNVQEDTVTGDRTKMGDLYEKFEAIDALVDRQQADGETLFDDEGAVYQALSNLKAEVRDLIEDEAGGNDLFAEDGEQYLYALNSEIINLQNRALEGNGSLDRIELVSESFIAAYDRATNMDTDSVEPDPGEPDPIEPDPIEPDPGLPNPPESSEGLEMAENYLDRALNAILPERKSDYLDTAIDLIIGELEGMSDIGVTDPPDPDGPSASLANSIDAFETVMGAALEQQQWNAAQPGPTNMTSLAIVAVLADLRGNLEEATGVDISNDGFGTFQTQLADIVELARAAPQYGVDTGGVMELLDAATERLNGYLTEDYSVDLSELLPETGVEPDPADPTPEPETGSIVWDFDIDALIPILRAMAEANRLLTNASDGTFEFSGIDPLAELVAATEAVNNALLDNIGEESVITPSELDEILRKVNSAQQALSQIEPGDPSSLERSDIAEVLNTINRAVGAIRDQVAEQQATGDE